MRGKTQKRFELLLETKKYAWLLRLLYQGSNAAARSLGVPKQTFSDWLNGLYATDGEQVQRMKEQVEAQPLSLLYQRVVEQLHLEKGRQGQRSDLKKSLQPFSVLGCKEKKLGDDIFLQLRPDRDEVVYFVGRADELIAKLLNLKSKREVHGIKKVIENRNPALTAKMDSGELTPYQAAELVGLPLDLQNTLLEKSRAEQLAGIQSWKVKQKQGGAL